MTHTQPTVSTYQLTASNGRPIRKATMVTFASGHVIRFMEKMSKRDALRQAAEQQIVVGSKVRVQEFNWHAAGTIVYTVAEMDHATALLNPPRVPGLDSDPIIRNIDQLVAA